jgi:hypothetical protein
MTASETRRLARQSGVADRTLDRAKRDVGVVSKREGFGRGSTVYWRLPGYRTPQDAIERHPPREAMYAESGDVWRGDPDLPASDDGFPELPL